MTLTTVILTKNEAANIKDAVENAKAVSDTVLVVDSHSTDDTRHLAEQAQAIVFEHDWTGDFSAQRNFALSLVKTEWVLFLDADERLNNQLVDSIKRAVQSDVQASYVLKRKTIAFGKEFHHGVLKPDYVPRLFKTSHVHWENRVHERPVCADQQVQLPGVILHFSYQSWVHNIEKLNVYTTIWAENALARNQSTTYMHAFGHATAAFFKSYFLQLGVLDGGPGIAMCLNHAFCTLCKYLKLIELKARKTP